MCGQSADDSLMCNLTMGPLDDDVKKQQTPNGSVQVLALEDDFFLAILFCS